MNKEIKLIIKLGDVIRQDLLDEKIDIELRKLNIDLDKVDWDSQGIERRDIVVTLDLYDKDEV